MTTKPGSAAALAATEGWGDADIRDHLSDSALTVGAGTPTDAGTGWILPSEHPDPIIAAGGIPDANQPSIPGAWRRRLGTHPGE